MKISLFAFLLSAVCMLLPMQVEAGLVPIQCTGATAPVACGTCEFMDLINNVIQFTITISSILATIIIVVVGFKLVTSAGNVSAVETAKRHIANVVIGYVLLLAAFIIVNTIIGMLSGDGKAIQWRDIECLYANVPERQENVSDLEFANNSISGEGLQDQQLRSSAAACSNEHLDIWGEDKAVARCIAQHESVCGASPISKTDVSRKDNNVFSFGVYQINTSVHEVKNCPGRPDLDCKSAWEGKNYQAVVINKDLYLACRDALLDPQCNTINAKRIFDQRLNSTGKKWDDWSTKSSCVY